MGGSTVIKLIHFHTIGNVQHLQMSTSFLTPPDTGKAPHNFVNYNIVPWICHKMTTRTACNILKAHTIIKEKKYSSDIFKDYRFHHCQPESVLNQRATLRELGNAKSNRCPINFT